MELSPFEMERWQSTFEHRVRFNLSESGVHPLTVDELLEMAGGGSVGDVRLGYGQSNGSDGLRERIAALHPGATEANVLVTTGGAEANLASFWKLLEPGGTVASMVPNYMQVPGLFQNFGAGVSEWPLLEEDGWAPDLDALAAALEAGARTVLVTNPNNPTGRALAPEAMDRIVALADRHGAWILADEVYRGAEAGGDGGAAPAETPSFWGRYDRVLVTNSLSKAYGLPGLRVGWVLGPEEAVADLWARTDYTTIVVSAVSDHLARIALHPEVRPRILERTRGIVRANLDLLREWADAHEGLFRYRLPDAGAICYLRYDAPVGSTALAEKLRTEKDVLVVPGDHFAMDRYLRIGFGPPRDELEEALGLVSEAFHEVAGAVAG